MELANCCACSIDTSRRELKSTLLHATASTAHVTQREADRTPHQHHCPTRCAAPTPTRSAYRTRPCLSSQRPGLQLTPPGSRFAPASPSAKATERLLPHHRAETLLTSGIPDLQVERDLIDGPDTSVGLAESAGPYTFFAKYAPPMVAGYSELNVFCTYLSTSAVLPTPAQSEQRTRRPVHQSSQPRRSFWTTSRPAQTSAYGSPFNSSSARSSFKTVRYSSPFSHRSTRRQDPRRGDTDATVEPPARAGLPPCPARPEQPRTTRATSPPQTTPPKL